MQKMAKKIGMVLSGMVMVLLMIIIPTPSHATTAKLLSNTQEKSAEIPVDSFGRETPRGAVQGLLRAIASEDYELAANYLDGRYLASTKTPNYEVVEHLVIALDAGGKLYQDLQISGVSEGDLSDNLPSDIDKVGELRLMNDNIDILLNRRVSEDGMVFWQVSSQTLAALPEKTIHAQTLSERLKLSQPGTHSQTKHWLELVSLGILVIGLYLAINLVVWVLYWVSKWLYTTIRKNRFRITPSVIMPLSLVFLAMILPEVMVRVGVPLTLRSSFGRIKDIVAWGATAWLMLRLLDSVFRRAEANSLKRGRPEQVSILNLLRKIAKALMIILAVILIFGNLGFDLTTGIAALGVGGLALAFGAQKTLENLIGSVVVVADRPVYVGDYCKFGTYEGTVIDIGIRSTRIRTLNRTVVTVPNGEFSSLQIENFTARDMFYFLHDLFIKRTADLAEIERMITNLQEFLATHRLTNHEWNQVWIKQLRQECYVIEMRAYIDADGAQDFYAKQSVLILEILKFLESYHIEHALPSQSITVHQNHDQKTPKHEKNPKT
ncbi:mechanosensitive ion channel family protein [Moraxella catarrhalis]|uniref:mechanosensitive ion channel family protein n=1 Tax=Moraxella catarrhalis TaxID=480 RepID=UPI0013D11F49|nr:mechanosensitive ion channel family protein [Moraxella catarrhalis]